MFRHTKFLKRRQSGLEADRPLAEENADLRYYATDTETIFISYGVDWHKISTLDPNKAIRLLDGTLEQRPDPCDYIGALYTDEDGLQYEAFPTAWATVNSQGRPSPSPVEDGQQIFDYDHLLSFDGGRRQLYWPSETIAMDWNQEGTIILSSLPTGDPLVMGQLWNNSGILNISAG